MFFCWQIKLYYVLKQKIAIVWKIKIIDQFIFPGLEISIRDAISGESFWLADFDFTHDGDEIDEDYSVGLLRRNRTEELEGAELPLPPR